MKKRKTFKAIGAGHEPAGMIYRGKDYTQQEIEALKKIQREHGISLDQAIQMAEQAAKATSSENAP